MRRFFRLLAVCVLLASAFAPSLADAQAGRGSSFGSRGTRTWSAPPSTNTAPYGGQSFQRSLTPNTPAYGPSDRGYGYGGYGNPGYGYGRSGFASGLMGGLIGAGIGGLLLGHGFFGGIGGFGSLFGLIIQLALIYFLVRWLFRTFASPAVAGGPGFFSRFQGVQGGVQGPRPVPAGGGAARGTPITVGPDDYQAFERMLHDVQAAWSGRDIAALQRLATPEMASYFGEQLAELASRGLTDTVSDVRLLQGDLSEAWSEGSREYATVAMRFTYIDVVRDQSGRVVDGSETEHMTRAELWTFLRSRGGRWVLSAIQQAR